ncbi:MAG: hypothetical protein U1F11_10900 [Steroidobacteraceae bacterium]
MATSGCSCAMFAPTCGSMQCWRSAGEALGAAHRCCCGLLRRRAVRARYASQHARRVAAVVLGAAGWYTYPDAGAAFPARPAPAAGQAGLQPDLDAFLACPTLVVVGLGDVAADPALNDSPDIVARRAVTGSSARRWVQVNAAAIERSSRAPARSRRCRASRTTSWRPSMPVSWRCRSAGTRCAVPTPAGAAHHRRGNIHVA